jgi:glycosyltransferase involved in cell wall biosynthesis
MSLRVLFVTSGLGVGGAERALESLLPGLQTQGIECAVVSLREPQAVGESLRALGVQVFELGMRPSRPSLAGLWRLWQIVRAFRPDVLQGWMYHGDLAAHLARLAAPRARVVLGIHQTLARLELESRATRLVIRADAWLSRFARRALYVAQAAQVQHEAAGFCAPAIVLPNGLDTGRFTPDVGKREAFRAALKISADELLVGMVGRLHPAKNHAGFLRAAALVAERMPQARFVAIGAGVTMDNPQLAELASAPALRGRVFLLGQREDVPDCLPGFDLSVLCSIQEALPNVVGEAMSSGLPCIVTNVGDAAWMIGDTGWVVPPAQDEALADAICKALAEGREAQRERGRLARQRAEQELSRTRVVERYAAFYRSL